MSWVWEMFKKLFSLELKTHINVTHLRVIFSYFLEIWQAY